MEGAGEKKFLFDTIYYSFIQIIYEIFHLRDIYFYLEITEDRKFIEQGNWKELFVPERCVHRRKIIVECGFI